MEPLAPKAGTAATPPERPAGEPDDRLLEGFLAGREEAFALLVRRYGPLVFHLCRKVLRHDHDAEDAFQATFLILARRARAIRRPDALGSWLCGVTTRVALRLKGQRRRCAEHEAPSMPTPSSHPRAPLDQVPGPPNRAPDPAAAAGQSDDEALLAEELGQLPDKYRAPLVHFYLEGQTTEEVAARLRCPVGTFRSRLAKARDLLRGRLTRRGMVLAPAAVAALLAVGAGAATPPAALLQAASCLARPEAPVAPRVAALAEATLNAMRAPKRLAGAATAGAGLVLVLVGLWCGGKWLRDPAHAPPAAPTGGTLIVANPRSATVTLIDVWTGRTRATVRTDLCTNDPCPQEVAVSPDGKTAAVSVAGLPGGPRPGKTIVLLDVAAGSVPKTLDLVRYTGLHGLHWLDDDRLLCVSETARALLDIDTKRAKVLRALRTDQEGARQLAVSADRRRAYVANVGSGTVTAFDLPTGRKLGDVEVGEGCEGLAVSPDGRRVWVAGPADRTVRVIDADELRVVKALPAPGAPSAVAFTPDGKTAVVAEPAGGELVVYDAATFQKKKRISFWENPGPAAVAFSPDGEVAYCTLAGGSGVAAVDLKVGMVVRTVKVGASLGGIAFSPVGGAQ